MIIDALFIFGLAIMAFALYDEARAQFKDDWRVCFPHVGVKRYCGCRGVK